MATAVLSISEALLMVELLLLAGVIIASGDDSFIQRIILNIIALDDSGNIVNGGTLSFVGDRAQISLGLEKLKTRGTPYKQIST